MEMEVKMIPDSGAVFLEPLDGPNPLKNRRFFNNWYQLRLLNGTIPNAVVSTYHRQYL